MDRETGRSRIKKLIADELEKAKLTEYRFLLPTKEEASSGIRTLVVVLFPYYGGEEEGNLSLYCRGKDYHEVVPRYLNPIGEKVKALCPEAVIGVYADTGPFNDRDLCLRAGLGVRGVNQMLIHPVLGSYFFIACMTLSIDLPIDEFTPSPSAIGCLRCGRCVAACPGECLSMEGEYHFERCRSGITQKKGELEPWEVAILKKDSCIFGCDLCQTVCPMNAKVEATPLLEFTTDRIQSLTKKDLEGLSNRTFKEKYPDRAFTWRGPAVIRRNLDLLEQP